MKINSKIKLIIVAIIMITILGMSAIANAASENNYTVGMSLTSNSKLKAGDVVTIDVNITNINAGNGIDTLTAQLEYDTNVFEAISTSDFTPSNSWKAPSYSTNSKMLTVQKDSKVKSAEKIFTISLKVKDTLNVKSTTITLNDITVSGGRVSDGGTGDITVNKASVTINADSSSNSGNKTENKTGNNTTVTNNTTIKDNTVSKKSTLPKTGIEQHGIIAIIVIAIAGVFSYVLYKKISKEVK